MRLGDLKNSWVDEPGYHQRIHELLCESVNNDEKLKEHRDWVEQNIFGFGERSFWWLWKLICDELPEDAKMLEIGVFKGATLSVWHLLLPKSQVYGLSPMDGTGLEWKDDDYKQHIVTIHDKFNQPYSHVFQGLSTSQNSKAWVGMEFRHGIDCLYIDGSHEYEDVVSDLQWYPQFVKSGGFLVVDDAACSTHQPFGYFQGIEPVCRALDEWLQTDIAKEFEFMTNVVHIMVYRRK